VDIYHIQNVNPYDNRLKQGVTPPACLLLFIGISKAISTDIFDIAL